MESKKVYKARAPDKKGGGFGSQGHARSICRMQAALEQEAAIAQRIRMVLAGS